jgi:ABC-2 type transport system ATP-binding protein
VDGQADLTHSMIECQGLTHRYGPLTAVEDLSFTVGRGEILGLLGPNGAGKTTAMRVLVGLLSPTKGSIRIQGHDMSVDSLEARRQLGYLPEAVPLYRELTVREFLDFAARMKGVPRAQTRSHVEWLVEACGLETVVQRLIGFCSRGFRQRIGLAQALAGNPPVLILDEPTVGLDPAQVVEIRESIAQLAKEKAVLLSTHILPEASLLCDRVLILHRGRRVAEDSPDNLAASLSGAPILRVVCQGSLDAAAAVFESHPEVRQAEPQEVARELSAAAEGRSVWRVHLTARAGIPALVRALVEGGCGVEEVRSERLGLEEVFLRLVREEPSPSSPALQPDTREVSS